MFGVTLTSGKPQCVAFAIVNIVFATKKKEAAGMSTQRVHIVKTCARNAATENPVLIPYWMTFKTFTYVTVKKDFVRKMQSSI